MPDPFKSIAIVVNSYFGPLMMELSAILRERHDCAIHLYCKSDILVKSYRNGPYGKLFSSVTNFMRFSPALRDTELDEAAELTEAREREQRLGLTYNTFAVANRHVGRGYALGGFYHPGSHYAEASYLQMVHAYNVQFRFWESEFRDKRVTLVLADNKEIAATARMLGIAYRGIARARYKNYHYWEENETREAHAIKREYDRLPARRGEAPAEVGQLPPYVAGKVIIRRAMKRAQWSTVVRQSIYLTARQAYWQFRRYEKAQSYYLRDQIRLLLRQRKAIQQMMGPNTITLEDLAGIPFIYYPLHTEPEQSLGQISPEFFFQLTAIAALSRDLPAGVTLAVKEVPMGCGRRPDNFYDQILQLKNVQMLNLAIPGPEVIRRTLGVATIAGTGGLEAALLGKPVISFGRHNPYNFLPHVTVVKDLAELPHHVRRLVEGDFDSAQARRNAERFVEAIEAASFDMGEFDYVDLDRFPQEAPKHAYRLLYAGFMESEEAGAEREPNSRASQSGASIAFENT